MKTLITMIAACFVLLGQAQNFTVKGTVKNPENEALEMANVIALLAKDSSMAGYAFTNPKGEFSLKVNEGENYILRVSYLGFATQDVLVFADPQAKELHKDVRLEKLTENLNEVQVVEEMPIMISGDTISYKADAFNTGTEKKLEDVVGNLPGFEVDEDGQIKVEGKTVEKIMVEGKEFFDGDTKVAMKNIPANAIDKVQVLRNYNDVSPLGKVSNNDDRIAINIKLKEGKKSMVFGDVEAAGGLDERYLGHANIFWYSPKASFNFIGDVNNVGKPAFTMRDYFKFMGGMRSISSKSGSNLMVGQDLGIPLGQDNRNTENISQFAAGNFNLNPNKSWAINGFAIILHNDVYTKSEALNNYVGQGDIINKEELTTLGNSDNKSFLGKFSATYTPSIRTHVAYDFFAKYSDISSADNQNSIFSLVNRDITSTDIQNPLEIKQNVEAIFDLNEKSIISLEGQYQYKKQDPFFDLLTTEKPNFALIPIVDSGTYHLQQSRLITTNKADVVLNYYYIINKMNHIEFTAGGSYTNQTLGSNISQVVGEDIIDFTDTNLMNDVRFVLGDVYGGVHYRTKFGKLTVKPGFNVHLYQTKDTQWGNQINRNWAMVLPDFYAKYAIKKSSSLTLNYSMQAAFTDVNKAALGVLIQSYNSLFMGNQYLDNALYNSVNMRYMSYNMFNFTTIYAGLTYNHRLRDITNTVTYLGIDRINSPINSGAANQVYSGYGGYQRRISYYKIGVNANVSYSLTNNLVNDIKNENVSLNQSYKVDFGTNFKKYPNLDVGYAVSLSNYSGNNVSNKFVNHAPFAKLEASFLKAFLLEVKYTYNNYSSPNNGPRTVYDFLDAALYYETKNEKWEFSINATNILETEVIRQDSFTNSVTSTSADYVLPRYVLLGAKYKL